MHAHERRLHPSLAHPCARPPLACCCARPCTHRARKVEPRPVVRRPPVAAVVLAEEGGERRAAGRALLEMVEGDGVVDALDQPRVRAGRRDPVRAQREGQARAAEDDVEGRDQLHRELLLPQLVVRLDDDGEQPPGGARRERRSAREPRLPLLKDLAEHARALARGGGALLARARVGRVELAVVPRAAAATAHRPAAVGAGPTDAAVAAAALVRPILRAAHLPRQVAQDDLPAGQPAQRLVLLLAARALLLAGAAIPLAAVPSTRVL